MSELATFSVFAYMYSICLHVQYLLTCTVLFCLYVILWLVCSGSNYVKFVIYNCLNPVNL